MGHKSGNALQGLVADTGDPMSGGGGGVESSLDKIRREVWTGESAGGT